MAGKKRIFIGFAIGDEKFRNLLRGQLFGEGAMEQLVEDELPTTHQKLRWVHRAAEQ